MKPQWLSRRAWSAWLPALLWMALIFFLSARSDPFLPSLNHPRADFLLRKAGHLTEYAILALLVYRPLRGGKRAFLSAFLIASLYAASDEWHQSFVPGREGTLRDWGIDSAGALVALMGWARLRGNATSSRG